MTTVPGEQAQPPVSDKRLPSNLTLRVLTGVIGLPIVLFAAFAGGWWFVALVSVMAFVGVLEFCSLGRARDIEGSGLVGVPVALAIIIGFYVKNPALWVGAFLLAIPAVFLLETFRSRRDVRRNLIKVLTTEAAVLYVGFPAAFLVATRNLTDGMTWLLMIFIVTWGTDTFAYIGGRLWGRTKLAPTISPKKTLEGAITGVVGGIVPAAILLGLNGKFSPLAMIPVAAGPLMAILGDLVESWLKRAFSVKDSHIMGFDILPGHGGVLDRVDALILVTTFSYLYLLATGLAAT
jgi:phosphatidate cytidylyltransferase